METLKVSHISKTLSKTKIIKDISFSLDEGEIVGFVGPNGSGKSTTLKLITNLLELDEGFVEICGINVSKSRDKAMSHVAAMIEEPGLYPFLTGLDHLKFIAKIRKKTKKEIEEVINFINIGDGIHKKTSKYSYGMRQRLGIGMCILADPKLLILDEPTNGLDPDGVFELRDLLVELKMKKNMAILFSSHNLSEINKICNRVIFIKQGSIVRIDQMNSDTDKVKYELKVNDTNRAGQILDENGYYYTKDHMAIHIYIDKDQNIGEIIGLLENKLVHVLDIKRGDYSVEESYSQLFTDDVN